jgi:hypothetical protein
VLAEGRNIRCWKNIKTGREKDENVKIIGRKRKTEEYMYENKPLPCLFEGKNKKRGQRKGGNIKEKGIKRKD